MRPRGEIRTALSAASESFSSPFTWRDLAASACVGFDAARQAVRDMQRAGELVQHEEYARVPGVNRPMTLYVRPAEPEASAGVTLANCWANFV
jgi:hypothetical protein